MAELKQAQYAQELGERLRAARNRLGLSMRAVETKSDRRWTAVAIGSYERGERALSVVKLAELADWYGVPTASLLPESGDGPDLQRAGELIASALAGLMVTAPCGCAHPAETPGTTEATR